MEQSDVMPHGSPAFWDDRYGNYVTVYGLEPNEFFKAQIVGLPAGKLLLPGEGEGRNAIFAAGLGWKVDAFDQSEAARSKAVSLAARHNVEVRYTTAAIGDVIIPAETYDAIGLIYLHLPPALRRHVHESMAKSLKKGGRIILEAFAKEQINNISGGPKDPTLLYDLRDVLDDFHGLDIGYSRAERIRLNEGPFHQGKADVIRILASKPV